MDWLIVSLIGAVAWCGGNYAYWRWGWRRSYPDHPWNWRVLTGPVLYPRWAFRRDGTWQ